MILLPKHFRQTLKKIASETLSALLCRKGRETFSNILTETSCEILSETEPDFQQNLNNAFSRLFIYASILYFNFNMFRSFNFQLITCLLGISLYLSDS